MRIVVALGGNALLERGQPMTMANQRENVRVAARAMAPLARDHALVISHGNGPQVGLLALQALAYGRVEPQPLDVLGAESEGMIGYMIEQELANELGFDPPCATVLTMVEVDRDDPAFERPEKPIGPVYDEAEARRLAAERGWAVARDGERWRRVVPSPRPRRILELRPIEWLLERGAVVVCTGGGGIPTVRGEDGVLRGIEAVIDKDRASALLAQELGADLLVMATDVDGVYRDWGRPGATRIPRATPQELDPAVFDAGSMGPKVEAAGRFVTATGGVAAIGALADLERMVALEAGTIIASSDSRSI